MALPEFVICLDCDTPCYVFEWRDEKLREALCEVCGNEDSDSFASPEALEELETAWIRPEPKSSHR